MSENLLEGIEREDVERRNGGANILEEISIGFLCNSHYRPIYSELLRSLNFFQTLCTNDR